MITLRRTIHTDLSPEQAFGYLSDFTNAEQWDAGTVTCTLISGDGGVGTRYRNVSRFLGRTTELVYVVQQIAAPTTYVIEGSNKTVTSTDTITIVPGPTGTAVTYQADFRFKGIARPLEPLLRLPIKRLGDSAERTLRDALAQVPR